MKHSRTLLSVSLGLMIVYLVFNLKAFLIAAIILVIISISSEKLRNYIGTFFIKIFAWTNSLLTSILLTIVYLLILTPTASLQKFFFQNPLTVRPGKDDSYFISRNHIYTSRDFENPW